MKKKQLQNQSSLKILSGDYAHLLSFLKEKRSSTINIPEFISDMIEEMWGEKLNPEEHVSRIIDDVKKNKDEAVKKYSQLFDKSQYDKIEVTRDEIREAFDLISDQQIEAIKFTINRIQQYHTRQLAHGPVSFSERGTGMIVRPLQRAGIYMTGSDASLPSSIIHAAIPGVVAGVDEIYGVTSAMQDGKVNPLKLVAAQLAGVQRIFRASGPQAIAAFAYGTESIPAVDKIFGPGNLFVTLAKQQVFGTVGIDALYGPTETMIIADDQASVDLVAADLLAQAEHDQLATPLLITDSADLASSVVKAVESQLETLDREIIARVAVANGGALVVKDLDDAITLANEYAPEHLCLLVEEPKKLIPSIVNAGGIFVGESSPEVLGDYTAGPSHIMPTGGSARFSSPLSVLDFLKITSIVEFDSHELYRQGPYASELARAEGLTGHARSIDMRIEGN